MAANWDDLLTVQEVQDAALQSSGSIEDNPSSVVEAAIRDVQDRIRSYLGMDPIVHRLTQGIAPKGAPGRASKWIKDRTRSPDKYRAWADHQPIVEVESPSAVSIHDDPRQFQRDRDEWTKVDYFAGWRRSDQTLADFNSGNSAPLPDLDTEPARLPDDIRRVAIALVIYEIGDFEHGTAIAQVEQAVGSAGTITVQGTDRDFVRRQLRMLSEYKVSSFSKRRVIR